MAAECGLRQEIQLLDGILSIMMYETVSADDSSCLVLRSNSLVISAR